MKKIARPSRDQRGFDSINGKYIRLDAEVWLAANRIREEGAKQGEQELPGTNDALPDATHRRVESWIGKRALDCRQDVKNFISDRLAVLQDLRTRAEQDSREIGLRTLVTQHCQNLSAKTDQSISDLHEQRAEYDEAARDLSHFRQRHGLSRVADYPDNQIAHWSWVPVLAIIESFVGANLLGSVSRGGVIEGWMVAAVLTAVNILLGIGTGKIWRNTYYRWGFRRISAYFSGVLCAAGALLWNGIAGHVRDVYVLAEKTGALEAPEEAFATAWRTMIEQPLPWESLQSAGLAVVGVAVFALTAHRAHNADDRFPGYGVKHRTVDILRERYQVDLNGALEDLEYAWKEANDDIDEVRSGDELDRAAWENTVNELRSVVDDYPMHLRLYNKDQSYLLAAYRTANLAARTTPPPPFFNSEPKIDDDVIQSPELSIPTPPEWGDIPNSAQAGFAQVKET